MSGLTRLQVEGFKSIRQLDLELGDLNVLIGANGSGKSNFIGLFRLLNQLVKGNLQIFVAQSGGANNLLYFGRKITEKLDIRINWPSPKNHLSQPIAYHAVLVPTIDDQFFFELEQIAYNAPANGLEGHNFRGHPESQLSLKSEKVFQEVAEIIRDWKVYHFHDTSASAAVKQINNIHDNLALNADAGNLAAYLYLLRETQHSYYDRIVETIQLAAPFFDDFVLRPSPFNPETIRLEWREKGNDEPFGAHVLSDGTLRFICLTTLLRQPNLPSTILIDEPELGLHPSAITLLADMLHAAAARTQVIVSTQSVTLVNHFAPEHLIVVDREDGQSVFRRLAAEALGEWLETYSIGELWEKNVLGGRP